MTGPIGILSSMSLVTSSLLFMQYLLVARFFRAEGVRLALRPALVAVGWLFLTGYLVAELWFVDARRVGLESTLRLEVLSLASLVLFYIAAIPRSRIYAIGSLSLLVASLATVSMNQPLPGGILGLLACGQMAWGFHRVLPPHGSRRFYLLAKISLLVYLLVGSTYVLFAFRMDYLSSAYAIGFSASLLAKLIHVLSVMGFLLELMGRVGAETEAKASLALQRRFISEVAHELQTPIVELKLRLSDFRARSSDHPLSAEIRNVLGAAERILAIVGGYWRFLAGLEPSPEAAMRRDEVADINSLIEAACISLQFAIDYRGRVSIVRSYASGARICCSPSEIVQLFINVFRNSVEAMPQAKGRIHIVTSRDPARDGGIVIVEIRDEGEGIAPSDAGRVFEAGFSTKAGVGRGFGLTIAKRIAEDHGGTLELRSQDPSSRGAHLRLCLPAAPTMGS